MSDISYADGPSHVAGSRVGPPDASSTNIIARPPGTADATWASFVDTLAKTGAYHPDALAKARAATEPGPPPAPATVPAVRPLEVIGPAGQPLGQDQHISTLSGSAAVSAQALGEIIAKGWATHPNSPEFSPPVSGRYEIAGSISDPVLHGEMQTQLLRMEMPAAHGRAMSRAFVDSAAEMAASPAYKTYRQAADDHALGRINDDELQVQSSAWTNYVEQQRKVVSNVLHRPYQEVVPIAALAVARLDKAVANRWAREGAFENAATQIALYKQGLLLQAKSKR